jgi:hypothetical protein
MCAPLSARDLIRAFGSIERAEKTWPWIVEDSRQYDPAGFAAIEDSIAAKALDDGWPSDEDLDEFWADQRGAVVASR